MLVEVYDVDISVVQSRSRIARMLTATAVFIVFAVWTSGNVFCGKREDFRNKLEDNSFVHCRC